jgi:hypothetical protein
MYQVSEDVRCTSGPDGGVALHVRRGQIFHLNPIGGLIFKSLQSGKSAHEIIDQIAVQCNVTAERVRPDILLFLRDLEQHDLVFRGEDSRP